MSKEREFLWRRLHSLLGVIPVGLFLVFHLCLNFTAIGGEETYNNSIGVMELLPHWLLLIMEWVIIYIPLLFHAFLGVWIAFTATYNTKRYGTFRNWMLMLQVVLQIKIFISADFYQEKLMLKLMRCGNCPI